MTLIPATRVGAQPTRSRDTYFCLRCGIWRVKKAGRSTRYCIDCLSVEPTLRRPS